MEQLEKYFDIAFAAPEGIKKLRQLILTLAMQGKLVPQDPNDQPASALLQEIETEKSKMVKAGKFRESKPLPQVNLDGVPHQLPIGWIWVRNSFLFNLKKGKVPHDLQKSEGSIPYLDIEALDKGNIRRYTNDQKTPQATDKDILVVCDGSRSGLILAGKNGAIGSTLSIIETPLFLQPFVNLIFKAGYVRFNSSMKGAAIPHLDIQKLLYEVTGLPPLAEQKRIVARIDQLMARCDELEKLCAERDKKRLTVHISALNRLFEAQGNESFTDAWQFINKHFRELYSVKANVTELRKAILQLGVMGKLVPQDPNDQPASALLQEIETEKSKMVKAGKFRESKPLPQVNLDGVPHQLPIGWIWVRNSFLFNLKKGKVPHDLQKSEGSIPYLDIEALDKGNIRRYTNDQKTPQATDKDILVVCDGSRSGLILAGKNGAIGSTLSIIETPLFLQPFVNLIFKAGYVRFNSSMKGAAIPHLDIQKLLYEVTGLPPLAEQKRIVAKIDQLMAMCDELEKQIDATADKQSALLNALMAKR
ncbi:MAG: restriction endonuclease subunit S [Chlorobiaceae bacterium]